MFSTLFNLVLGSKAKLLIGATVITLLYVGYSSIKEHWVTHGRQLERGDIQLQYNEMLSAETARIEQINKQKLAKAKTLFQQQLKQQKVALLLQAKAQQQVEKINEEIDNITERHCDKLDSPDLRLLQQSFSLIGRPATGH